MNPVDEWMTAPVPPADATTERPRCRCTHDTSDPERGCECGYADWMADR